MKYQLSIVAIFKNEHRFIVQWIKLHLKVGVDHFYLYDNGGDHWKLLEPFQEFITYMPWTDEIAAGYQTVHQNQTRQKSAYTHCVDHFRDETKWIQLLDLDEFLVPISSGDVKQCLKLEEADSISTLRIPRFNFGNSGNWKPPVEPILERYRRRERRPSHFKDLGRMDRIQKVMNPHLFRVKGKVVKSSQLYIHHHYTRSLTEWLTRSKSGGGQAGKGFRWFIGQRPWLAFISYAFLNIRSIYPIALMIFLSFSVVFTYVPFGMLLLNIPLLIWAYFAWQRGQNEVRDSRLKELMEN